MTPDPNTENMDAYMATMRAKTQTVEQMRDENRLMREMLREFVTPPLAFTSKKELIEKTRLLIEGWK